MDRKSLRWIGNLRWIGIIKMDKKSLRWIGNHYDG